MPLRTADGLSLNVPASGPPGATPILFIHGFPLSGEMWAPAVHALEDRFHCITPDLRGHGASDPPDPDNTTISTYADDCAAALTTARPAVVCGLSMGGIIALDLFRRHRDLVRALVLCDTRADPETPEGITTREQRARLALDKGPAGVRQIADAMINNLVARDAEPAVRDAVHAMMVRAHPAGLAAASRALGMRPDLRPILPRIDAPTLLIVGEEDAITPPELTRDMQRSIPGARLVVVPGAGHVPPMERPAEFNHALRAFLERLG